MLKLLGSTWVLCGGLLAVWQQMRERCRRRETLAALISALRRMAEEIRLTRAPLPLLLEQAAAWGEGDAKDFFLRVSAALRQGEAVGEGWRQAAEALPLTRHEKSIVSALEKPLRGDEESACKGISLAIYELAKSMEEWDKTHPEEVKRTAALYLSGAALLVILLL